MEQLLVYGIILGSIIALGAIGLSLTYGILNFPNFAHGDMMALGAYLALFLHAGLHWPLTLAAAGAIVLTGVIAIGIDRAIYRRLRRTGPVSLLIASVGVALVVRYGIQLIWGPQTEVYIQGIQLPYRFDWLGGIRIKPSQIGILITAGLLVVAVHLLLTRTRLGKAMRALADNPELARVSGIPTERVIAWTWALGSGLAAAGGILLGIETFLRPPMGWNVLLPIVAAVILGGIGSAHGAMLGGMIIGVSQELSTAFLPTEYKPLIAFALLVAILIARPSGLAGVPAGREGTGVNAWEGIVSYAIFFLINAGIYAVFTLGLNVQWGYTGLFNVGIAGFSMIGAYTSALLTTPASDRHLGGLGLPIPFGIAGAALAAGLLALLIGWITLRLRDDYLAIATLGIAEVLRLVIKNEGWFGGGVQGISDIPRPLQGLFDAHYNAIFLIVLLGLIALLYWAVEQAIRSPWGRVLRAIREDEIATAAAGKDTVRFRMEALVFGACLMGIGGALYAHFIGYLSPDAFEPMNATFLVWAMLIVGGSGNNRGALLGALVVWAIWSLTEFFTDFLPAAIGTQAAAVRIVLIGLLLIIMLIWRPQGLLGEERQVSRWVAERLQRDRAHEG